MDNTLSESLKSFPQVLLNIVSEYATQKPVLAEFDVEIERNYHSRVYDDPHFATLYWRICPFWDDQTQTDKILVKGCGKSGWHVKKGCVRVSIIHNFPNFEELSYESEFETKKENIPTMQGGFYFTLPSHLDSFIVRIEHLAIPKFIFKT